VLSDLVASSPSYSSLRTTTTAQGTPLYSAPERLVNPFDTSFTETVARASKSTDMYSFGLICWEVLSGVRPFPETSSESALCSMIHKGMRPSLELIPKELMSSPVKDLITSCWGAERNQRKTAMECYTILSHAKLLLSTVKEYDVFLSHSWTSRPFVYQLCCRLRNFGFRVLFESSDIETFPVDAFLKIQSCSLIIAFLDCNYLQRPDCRTELCEISSIVKNKQFLSVVLDEFAVNYLTANCCEDILLRSKRLNFIDSVQSYREAEIANNDTITSNFSEQLFNECVVKIVKYLAECGCVAKI
jgi:serine/threonine protein kinase